MTGTLAQSQTFFSEMTRTYKSIESESFELGNFKITTIQNWCQMSKNSIFLQKNVIIDVYFYESIQYLELNSSKLNLFLL